MSGVIMKSTLTHLSRVYLWPKSKTSTTRSAYLTLLLGSFLLFGSLLHLIRFTWKKENNSSMVETIENVTSQIGVIYFSVFFIKYRKYIVKIVSDLSDFDKFGKPPHFDARNQELDVLARLFRIWLYSAVIGFCAWPAIYAKKCQQLNEDGNELCSFVSPIWLPFDFNSSPVKQFVYVWQCYCCLVTYGAAGTLSVTIFETMEHLVVRIQHLKMLLSDIMEEPNPILKQELLTLWVQYHLYIFRIGKDMNDSYVISLSTHVLVAGVLFGLIGHIIMENALTLNSVFLFFGWFASLFVVCLGGQHLKDESLSVGLAIYNTKWYQLDAKLQKHVILIMRRSQRPILIHAGPFTFLSLLLILGVLQTAYSYINLLNVSS